MNLDPAALPAPLVRASAGDQAVVDARRHATGMTWGRVRGRSAPVRCSCWSARRSSSSSSIVTIVNVALPALQRRPAPLADGPPLGS